MSETLHPDIPDNQLHPCKGFADSVKNNMLVKDEQGALLWEDRYLLPPAKNFVLASSAPPTESNGDIYVIVDSTAPHADWDGAAEDSWVRFDTSADTWFSINPVEGIRCYDKTLNGYWEYDGNNWISGAFSAELTIATSDVLTLNGTPIELVAAPGSGKVIELISWATRLVFVSAAYDTNTELELKTDTADQSQGSDIGILLSTVTRTIKGGFNVSGAPWTAAHTQSIENKALQVTVKSGNPGTGDSDITIYATYRIIQL
jgi:hypothetical protein